MDGAPGCAGGARPGPEATVETRLGWEAGGGLGAPGGPGGSGGAGAWLKGGPTPGAACWRGLMGETGGETKAGNGDMCRGGWPAPPTPILAPGLTARAQPGLLVLGSLHSILGGHLGCTQPRNLGLQGRGWWGPRARPGVPWGHAIPAPTLQGLMSSIAPQRCDSRTPRVQHPHFPSSHKPSIHLGLSQGDRAPTRLQKRVPLPVTSLPGTAGGQGAEAAGGLRRVRHPRVELEAGVQAALAGGCLGLSHPQLRATNGRWHREKGLERGEKNPSQREPGRAPCPPPAPRPHPAAQAPAPAPCAGGPG